MYMNLAFADWMEPSTESSRVLTNALTSILVYAPTYYYLD